MRPSLLLIINLLLTLALLEFVAFKAIGQNSTRKPNHVPAPKVQNPKSPDAPHRKELNFKSVQIGNESVRTLRLSNGTGATITIEHITFDNAAFRSFVSSLSIEPFSEVTLAVTFRPVAKGIQHGFMNIALGERSHPSIKIKLTGEGLDVPPISISPESITATIDRDSAINSVLTITNNGAFTRTYNIAVLDRDYLRPSTAYISAGLDSELSGMSMGSKYSERRKPLRQELTISEVLIPNLPLNLPDTPFYMTGFEEFLPGPIHQQNNWESSGGWEVSNGNPDQGGVHLRGISGAAGEETYAGSPGLHEWGWDTDSSPMQFMFSGRVNIERALGSTWDITLRDNMGIGVANVRINADRSVVTSGMSGLGYRGESVPLDVPVSGYFDIAIDISRPTSGEPAFDVINVFINQARVYRGYSMGLMINQVTFTCRSGQPGSILDIDDFLLCRGNFIPAYITPASVSGILRPKETKQIPLNFDVSGMKFGTYNSQIIATIDSTEQFSMPVSVRVTGSPELRVRPEKYFFIGWEFDWMDFLITNEGGENVHYTIDEIQGAFNGHEGVITPESAVRQFIRYGPKVLVDSLTIRTDIPDHPVYYVPIVSIDIEPMTEFYISTPEIHLIVNEGETVTDTLYLANLAAGYEDVDVDGNGTWVSADEMGYYFLVPPGKGFSVSPYKGILAGLEQHSITISLDARDLSPGIDSATIIVYNNNRINPAFPLRVTYEVLPANQSTSMTSFRREQTGFGIYPNPTGSPTFTIHLTDGSDGAPAYCSIVSLTGKVVHEQALATSRSDHVIKTDLRAGVYIVNVMANGHRYTARLVVY